MSLGFQLISAFGTIAGGVAAQRQAQLDSFNVETQRKEYEVVAFENARARREEYDLALSSNITNFYKGRDAASDRSVEAFLAKNLEKMSQDQKRISNQSQRQSNVFKMEAMAVKRRGNNQMMSSLFTAAGQVAKGIDQYGETGTLF